MTPQLSTRTAGPAVLAAAVSLLTALPGEALYIRVETEKVPVERLVKNLSDAVEKDPKSVPALLNLARVHAMAYSLKTETAEVAKGKAAEGWWFGYEPPLVPFNKTTKTDDAGKLKAAKAHLERAVELYKKAVTMAPDDPAVRLGYGWVLDQSGKKEEAIKEYRKVIEEGWKKEKDLQAGPLGGHYLTVEAAGYLIPLLDKEKDKEEIKTLTDRSEKLKKLPRPVTPIAVPLRDGLRATDIEDRAAVVAFDADGTGLPRRWSWITPDAAWLVYDPTASGKVNSALQMFGNVTFWLFWENGYEALASLDDDRDGRLTGDELRGLALWHDANRNGVCDPGEVKPLASHGITGLSCRHERDATHPDAIAYSPAGVTLQDGRTRPTYDIVLHSK